MQDQEGRVTHFPSGIAGVAVVLFALMGTIAAGFLLNGTTGYQTVNDYDYVTDVSGLYSYTPVTAYADYSPAQNNYQYNTDASLLGTYTDGITYTAAAAANLNPIITEQTGYQTVTDTIDYASLQSIGSTVGTTWIYMGAWLDDQEYSTYDDVHARANGYLVSASDLVNFIGPHVGNIEITLPTTTLTYTSGDGGSINVQQCSIAASTNHDPPISLDGISATHQTHASSIINYSTSMAFSGPNTSGYGFHPTSPLSSAYYNNHTTALPTYISSTDVVGVESNVTINANGTTTYSYTYDGTTTTSTISSNSVNFLVWQLMDPAWTGDAPSITYTATVYTNVEYLDPNYGVSISDSDVPVYWSNSNNLGSVTWAFKKPDTYSNIQIFAYNSSTALYSFNVNYSNGTGWRLTYDASNSTDYVSLGSDWSAVYVRMYYTGEVQAGAIDGFFNFTNYTMKLPTTYSTAYSGNVPITKCKVVGTTTMNFACIGTTVESGTVPGAMYDASFDVSSYFPSYTNVRISFDSAAYVGSSVTTGTWTMAVDSSTFTGTFTVGATTYHANLTQPWALIWDPAGHVDITFTGVNELGTQKVTILDSLNTPAVALGGQWVLDTDLYTVRNHTEEVYDWNFGEWGLDRAQFIVCAMGMTALISILMKLGGVPFRMLDFIVILFGNIIFWVIL